MRAIPAPAAMTTAAARPASTVVELCCLSKGSASGNLLKQLDRMGPPDHWREEGGRKE